MKDIEIVSAADASVDIDSPPVDVGEHRGYSIQATFSDGSLGGTLTLEASNDGVTFSTVTDSDQVVASGAQHVYSVVDAEYRFARLHWAASAGTGTLTARCIIKEPSNRY